MDTVAGRAMGAFAEPLPDISAEQRRRDILLDAASFVMPLALLDTV